MREAVRNSAWSKEEPALARGAAGAPPPARPIGAIRLG
jgi:hypothetical protein